MYIYFTVLVPQSCFACYIFTFSPELLFYPDNEKCCTIAIFDASVEINICFLTFT